MKQIDKKKETRNQKGERKEDRQKENTGTNFLGLAEFSSVSLEITKPY